MLRVEEIPVLLQDSKAPQSMAAAVVHSGCKRVSVGALAGTERRHQSHGHFQRVCGKCLLVY
jgi:hypothetical protein